MKALARFFSFVLIALISFIIGAVVAGFMDYTPSSVAEEEPVALQTESDLATHNGVPDFVPIVERVNPAVVSIYSSRVVEYYRSQPFMEDPFEFFFGPRRQQRQPERRRLEGGGSGIIINENGLILTNFHVIEEADDLNVRLSDGESFKAEVVGRDQTTDIALIKIKTETPLPYATLGDSDKLRVGEWVLAIGNPYQYEHTVSAGVVSAKGRRIPGLGQDLSFQNFIQTDAAINPGNSGGPLINMRGEVVGINTAMRRFAQSIGFAIPVNIAKQILPQLQERGEVQRGFLGVSIVNINPQLQEAFNLKSAKGTLVQEVTKGLPADLAGLARGDVIIGIDGQEIENTQQLIEIVSKKSPGEKVKIEIIRNERKKTLQATLAERSTHLTAEGERRGPEPPPDATSHLGIDVRDLTPRLRQYYRIEGDVDGVVVSEVDPLSEASDSLVEGDVIVEVNRQEIRNIDDYWAAIEEIQPGDTVLLYVISPRRNFRGYVTLNAEEGE